MEGLIGVRPEIKKVIWLGLSKIEIFLKDGRIIIVPLKFLPSAKKVKPSKRKKVQIIDRQMFTWDTCPEVYHIEQILGKEKDYAYIQ